MLPLIALLPANHFTSPFGSSTTPHLLLRLLQRIETTPSHAVLQNCAQFLEDLATTCWPTAQTTTTSASVGAHLPIHPNCADRRSRWPGAAARRSQAKGRIGRGLTCSRSLEHAGSRRASAGDARGASHLRPPRLLFLLRSRKIASANLFRRCFAVPYPFLRYQADINPGPLRGVRCGRCRLPSGVVRTIRVSGPHTPLRRGSVSGCCVRARVSRCFGRNIVMRC